MSNKAKYPTDVIQEVAADSLRVGNPFEQLEKEVAYLRDKVLDQEQELLGLYRRLIGGFEGVDAQRY